MKTIPFAQRMQPALTDKGFQMEDYWVWCGSVVKEHGRYYMFASRWPKALPFYQGYLAASQIVRASSDTPEGPYTFEEVIFADRGEQFWDGRMTHNPYIVKHGDEYLLFYIGATYAGDRPSAETLIAMNQTPGGNGTVPDWFGTIRIGMARATSVKGPWIRPDQPTLNNNPAGWDRTIMTNPTPCVGPDGQVYVYYRSSGAKLGVMIAEHPDAAFERPVDHPVFDPGKGLKVEDPCVFWLDDHFEMVCKDLTGKVTGEFHAAVHLISKDGITWELVEPAKAWSRTIIWDDGRQTTQGSIERPYVLFESGEPRYLFAATANGTGPQNQRPGHYYAEKTWNMVIPLQFDSQR